ncbi:hypothetical protein [Solimonas marina]|uniref:Uncharacterized protein n=1 Tax=Solimonas marina TaxID=2714601 RepID=A0A970B8A7_9GAMM|nr:hypothetical protein [Solimonas marina]NKF24545.1 hypothetical protein [Solimonas marina]
MKYATSMTLKSAMTAMLLLPLCAISNLAFADGSTDAAGTPTRGMISAGDDHCIALHTRYRLLHGDQATATLFNRCDYPVVVSYCVDDPAAGPRACGAADTQVPTMQVLAPRTQMPVQLHDAKAAGTDVNWIACRSTPGMTSRFRADNTIGECATPGNTMQARSETDQLQR